VPVPRRQGPLKEAPPPLQVDTARVVLAGIGIWTVALVVLLVLGDRVDRLWTWTCLAAIALGLLGLWIMKLQGQAPRRRSDKGDPDAG
jgi:multidrug transporter EmrE-like cation transporter